MSSSERERKSPFSVSRFGAIAGLLMSVAAMSACTVQPLYSNSPSQPGSMSSTPAELSSIAIKPVSTRYGQEVRNHLIFMFNGGKGQPAEARYSMDLRVTAVAQSAALVQRATESEPTAGVVTMTGIFNLTEIATGTVIAQGQRQISSSYDRPLQEFAALRAIRNAEDRAARELAELLRIGIAQELARKPR